MTVDRFKVVLVAGARPNFMKVAPIIRELKKHDEIFDWRLVHTGQHFDRYMSDVFFEELGIPKPDLHMDAGGGTHAEQTARIMVAFEKYCADLRPDIVIVVGDVNSTLACSIVAKKLCIRVAHVEAGLRSGDMRMPEEVNRIVTDSISDLFFVTETSAVENLLKEGHSKDRVHFVGHVMIDNLFYQLAQLERVDTNSFATSSLKKRLKNYGVVTMHRPSNVDEPAVLNALIGALTEISKELPLIFPVHPRTRANLERFGIKLPDSIHSVEPLPYMDFLNLWKDATVVLTDSGGLQEESTALGIPCITLRENTERPVTVTHGSNVLAGTQPEKVFDAFRTTQNRTQPATLRVPPLWDGLAATRIVKVLQECLQRPH